MRKKNSRQRGSTTHGWGSMKKHRGAGHRGGRGAAGSGKRGDAKKPSFWKVKRYAGKHGFTSHSRSSTSAMNVGHLASSAARLAREGLAEEKSGTFTIDLQKLGINRLLGTGAVRAKLAVTVERASARAVEKVQAAGGTVTVSQTE